MIEGKKGSLALFIERTQLVGDVAVCLSFKVKLSSCCLNKLKGSCACNCFPDGSEESCVCYALFLVVKNALCGSPLATKNSKVGDVSCGVNNGAFFISWKVKGTGSAVRKSLGIALRNLAPGKLYSVYAHCVKEAGGKPSKDSFAYAADQVIKSINSNVHCGVVGNIRLVKKDPATKKDVAAIDIDAMIDILSAKINPGSVAGSKKEPAGHKGCDHANRTEVAISGWQSFVLKSYLDAKVRGLHPAICDRFLLIAVKPAVWETISKKAKKYVKDYVDQKYSKVGSELPALLGYMMLASTSVSCIDVHSMIKSGVTPAQVVSAISSGL